MAYKEKQLSLLEIIVLSTIGPQIIQISIIRTHAYPNSAPYYFNNKNTAVDYNYMLTSSRKLRNKLSNYSIWLCAGTLDKMALYSN